VPACDGEIKMNIMQEVREKWRYRVMLTDGRVGRTDGRTTVLPPENIMPNIY